VKWTVAPAHRSSAGGEPVRFPLASAAVRAHRRDVATAAHRGIVVLAEDEVLVRESVAELLEDEGFLVLPVKDGQEALRRLRGITGSPVVAVIDLMMPDMDGRILARTMRADDALRKIPILVVTSRPDEVPEADRVLRKPCPPEELLAAVDALCHLPG
jgi:DNA-binding response OmpR family regulator